MIRLKSLLVLCLALFVRRGIAETIAQSLPAAEACAQLNQRVLKQVAEGHMTDAQRVVIAALERDSGPNECACAGVILSNLALAMSVSGRLADAASVAQRSIDTFLRTYAPDDGVLLRPLQILAAAEFELGRKAKARETFKRMQAIRAVRAEDRALVHGLTASLLEDEGTWPEAESEYSITISAWREAGRAHTVDGGVVLTGLGALYVKEYRLKEAERTLADAAAILGGARDTAPIDRIHLLLVRGALYCREKNWRAAEQDLEDALAIADREPYIEPETFSFLLNRYAWVLNRNHHKRQARQVKARLKSLNGSRIPDPVVDVGDLLSTRHRK